MSNATIISGASIMIAPSVTEDGNIRTFEIPKQCIPKKRLEKLQSITIKQYFQGRPDLRGFAYIHFGNARNQSRPYDMFEIKNLLNYWGASTELVNAFNVEDAVKSDRTLAREALSDLVANQPTASWTKEQILEYTARLLDVTMHKMQVNSAATTADTFAEEDPTSSS